MNGKIGGWGTIALVGAIFAAAGLASGQPFAIIGLILLGVGLMGALFSRPSPDARADDRAG